MSETIQSAHQGANINTDFSLVIVSWNVRERLRENLLALRSCGGASFEVIVVDNNSADTTIDMLRNDFPEVTLIANNENVGFGRACNQGLKVAGGDYLVLLNPDMKIQPSTLSDLKTWLDANQQADVTGIKLVDEQGKILPHVRRFPRLLDQLAIILKLPHLFPHLLDAYLRKTFNYEAAAQVDSIRGAFFVIRRSALEKFGLLDERYFLWFEEVDYCRTVQQSGGQVWYTPSATCTDYVGASFNQVGRGLKQKYFRESMLKYFMKWGGAGEVLLLRSAWLVADVIMALAGLLKLKARTRT